MNTMPTQQMIRLTLCTNGQKVRVAAILGGSNMMMRLTELGLHLGAELEVRQNHGGALIVMCGNARIAIGAGMAHKIMVEPLESLQ